MAYKFLAILTLLEYFHPFFGQDCGFSYGSFPPGSEKKHLTRVLYGKFSRVGDWPWVVQIHQNYRPICSGSIISPRYILSAFHCTLTRNESAYWTIHYETIYGDKGSVANVRRLIPYPDQNATTYFPENDIAIFELEEPLVFNKNVSPVCLPKTFIDYPAQPAFFAGFGAKWNPETQHDDITMHRLCQDVIPIQAQSYCQKNYDLFNNSSYVEENYICAGSDNLGATHGDSGGPLMVSELTANENGEAQGRWFIVGICTGGTFSAVSILPNETNSYYPPPGQDPWGHDIFARVTQYCDWIEKVTNGEAKCI